MQSIFRWTNNVTACLRRIAVSVFVLMCSAALSLPAAFAQQKQPDDPFLPLNKLPPTEQFPAARLLIAAYIVKSLPAQVVSWLVVFVVLYASITMLRAATKERVQIAKGASPDVA